MADTNAVCLAMDDARLMEIKLPRHIIIDKFVDWGDKGAVVLRLEMQGVEAKNQDLMLKEALKRLNLRFITRKSASTDSNPPPKPPPSPPNRRTTPS